MIFKRFSQTDQGSNIYGGTGLGLAISKTFIELMKGEIWVESRMGKGSTFQFVIPMEQGEKAGVVNAPMNQLNLTTSDRKLNILLAEDNPVNIKLIRMVLGKLGHKITIVKNGSDALHLLKNNVFDLILMDIEMPEMNGIEASTQIREGKVGALNQHIPIIAITAHVLDEVVEKCKKAGINQYVSKPLNINRLDQIMQDVIQESKT